MKESTSASAFLGFSKVLDFLLENRIFDYSRRELAEHSGAGASTINVLWGRLVSHGIVVETRRVGKTPRYALNTESPLVKQLIELDLKLAFGDELTGNPKRKETAPAAA